MASLPVPIEIEDLIEREWERLSRAGTWFRGDQRVALAAAARAEKDPASPAERAAKGIYDQPAELRREWLAELEEEGLTLAEYVEVLGVTSRLRAIDTFLFGVGLDSRPLPDPIEGEPTRETVGEASLNGGWVPTVGPAWPPSVLSSVSAENDAMEDVHEALYLAATFEEDGNSMGNVHVVRDGLTRSQMEFVAARTSLVNDCFY